MVAIAGSALPIRIEVEGVDLTGASVTVVFALRVGLKPFLTKTTGAGQVTVTYDAVLDTSIIRLTLSDTETKNMVGDIAYTVYVEDGSEGGAWIPDNGGVGTITFKESVPRA